MRAALAAVVVIAHALAFAWIAPRCHGPELAVTLHAPPASPVLALNGELPTDLHAEIEDRGTGLVHRTWRVRYRGGVVREVGAAQLVGPLQDPDAPACVGRVVVGQQLLDDGSARGTIAAAMKRELTAELRGMTAFPAGDFVRIDHLVLRWAQPAMHPDDRAMLGAAPHGYVRASATIVFERVAVPVIVALVPSVAPSQLTFRVAARAQLAFDNRAMQWLSDKLGGDRLATRLARHQIDDSLVAALAPPPPLTLAGGQVLRFAYCSEPAEIVDGTSGALPFGVVIARGADPRILPPKLGRGPRAAKVDKLALDLDLDALNALLYELWRGGFLDRQLAAAGLDRRFNADPTVTQLLSLRIEPPRLTLPPVVTPSATGLHLAAEAKLAIHDGNQRADGRVWGGLDFRFAARSVDPVAVELDALALTCERGATLVPCYGDLVAALRGRTAELHGALTETFARLLTELFVGRVGAAGVPAELDIRGVAPSVLRDGPRATLHLALDAAIATP